MKIQQIISIILLCGTTTILADFIPCETSSCYACTMCINNVCYFCPPGYSGVTFNNGICTCDSIYPPPPPPPPSKSIILPTSAFPVPATTKHAITTGSSNSK